MADQNNTFYNYGDLLLGFDPRCCVWLMILWHQRPLKLYFWVPYCQIILHLHYLFHPKQHGTERAGLSSSWNDWGLMALLKSQMVNSVCRPWDLNLWSWAQCHRFLRDAWLISFEEHRRWRRLVVLWLSCGFIAGASGQEGLQTGPAVRHSRECHRFVTSASTVRCLSGWRVALPTRFPQLFLAEIWYGHMFLHWDSSKWPCYQIIFIIF